MKGYAWLLIMASLSGCATYAWVHPTNNSAEQLNRDSGECTAQSYSVVPVPNIQPPVQPRYGSSSQQTNYTTNYSLMNNSGSMVTGTAVTTQTTSENPLKKHNEYAAAKGAYDEQIRMVNKSRLEVFNACLMSKGWVHTRVEKK